MASDSTRLRAAAAIAFVEETILRPKTLRPVTSLAALGAEERQRLANRKAGQVFALIRDEIALTQMGTATLTGDAVRTIGNWERAEVDLGALRAFVQMLEERAERRKGGK